MIKDYVEWFNNRNPGAWPTWTPGDYVDPGDIGFFAKEKNFCRYSTIGDVGVTPERPVASQLHFLARDFRIAPSATVTVPIGPHPLAFAAGEVTFTAQRDNASLLQIDDAFECGLVDRPGVLDWVRQRLLAGQWEVDFALVTRRIRAESGFARILTQRGQAVKMLVDGKISPAELTLAKIQLAGSASRRSYESDVWVFNKESTPIFMDAIRIHTKWWARLIPGLGPLTGREITDHAGHNWRVDKPPWNLRYLPKEHRLYDPRHSVMRPDEIEALAQGDLFQVVRHLGLEDEEPPPEGRQEPWEDLHGGPANHGTALEIARELEAMA